jgi:DNA-binding GntR family transcriptional regulator
MPRRSDLRQVAPQQLKDVVYERLRDALVDLTFQPGEALREAALVERLGVSKTPIREALVRLERDGLVETAPYRGARARTYTADDLRELFEVRELIESECVRRAAHRGDRLLVDDLARNVADTEAALERHDLRRAALLLDEFDDLLFAQLDNQMLTELLDQLGAHLRRIGRLGASEQRFHTSVAEHREVLDAIEARRPAAAKRFLRQHLQRLLHEQLASAVTGDPDLVAARPRIR